MTIDREMDRMVFWTVIPDDFPENHPAILKWITEDDRFVTERRGSGAARRNTLLARGGLRALLFHVTGKLDWVFKSDPRGKPFIQTPDGAPGPHVSLSHTRGMVACAISQSHPLGIDIERHRPRDFSGISAFAFGPDECAYAAGNGMEAFYKIWTLREAISKATGEGLRAATDGQDRIAAPMNTGCWTDRAWNLFYAAIRSNYSVAIATQHETAWSDKNLFEIDPMVIA